MSENNAGQPASTALWYFVGATFVFALPSAMFPGLPWWARLALALAGFVVLVAGFVQLRRESLAKRRSDARDDSTPPPAD